MKFSTHQLVEVSILVALAFVLDFVAKIYSGWFWTFGGSISLSLVPLAILGYRQGWKVGFLGGFLMGVVQLLYGATILHPVQVLLDYPLPFAALGLAGLWAKQVKNSDGIKRGYYIGLSTLVASFARLICHTISGYVFFRIYTPAGMNPWLYSVGYNIPYVALSWVISVLVLVIIYRRYFTVINK